MFIEYQEVSSSMLGALSIKCVSWDLCPLRVSSMIRENFFIHVIEIAHICIAPCNCNILYTHLPGGSDGKESACNAGDPGSIPGSRRSPGEGNGNPLQYSCLENPMDRRAWRAIIHGVLKIQTQLSD